MKTFLTLAASLFLSQALWAQQCEFYHPLEEGYTFETEFLLGAKNKPAGTGQHTVEKVETISAGKKATIKLQPLLNNKKPNGKPGYYTVQCLSDGSVKVDNPALSNDWMDLFYGMEGGCPLDIPKDLKVGHTWPDCEYAKTEKKAKMQVRYVNRKVSGKETITIGTETYEAFVIEYEMHGRIKEGLVVRVGKECRAWFVPGKGVLRSQNVQQKAFEWVEKW